MKSLKIVGIIILLLLLVAAVLYFYVKNKTNNIENTHDLASKISKNAQNLLQKEGRAGLVIGIVKDGKTFIKGFGTTQKGSNAAPDSITLFELASVGKLFTTLAIQIGVERGDFNWDDKISKYLSSKVNIPPAYDITLRSLATHTSGLPSLPKNMMDKMTDDKDPYKDLSINDLYDYLKTCNENTHVGESNYSNLGMGLLGHILELKYGKKYEDIVIAEMCSKLDMSNTLVTLSDENKRKLAQGYDETGNPNPVWQDTVLTGAGSFLSTAADMVKFIKANLNVRNSPISSALMACHIQQLGGETGLGWQLSNNFIDKMLGHQDVIWHNGMAGGYSSYLAIDTKAQCGIIILSNSAKDITTFGMRQMLLVKNISLE
jgi:serine-type D-Ala-D-Ala carboxypeptidase/endopeptidase